MGTESVREQIEAAIVTELEAIEGDSGTTYWYTPDKVVRVSNFEDRNLLRTDYPYTLFVRDTGPERPIPRMEGGYDAREFDVYVLMAKIDPRGERDPYLATTAEGTIRNRMIKDVIKKLNGNYNRNGLSFNTEHEDDERDFKAPGEWIVGGSLFTVTYEHALSSP